MKLKYKICFLVALLLTITSWLISISFWDKLPAVIPVHFGITGAADGWAEKSFLYVFLIPMLQTFVTALFIVLYYKPQYTNMPSTMWLMTLDKSHREHAFSLIRSMMAGTIITVGVLFTYMAYGMNIAALDKNAGLSPVVMVIILVAMFVWIIIWSIKIYKETKLFIKRVNKKEDK